jgi:hypothetical protein
MEQSGIRTGMRRFSVFAFAVLLFSTLPGCGGGGGGGGGGDSGGSASVAIAFPPPTSLTEGSSVVVRGTASSSTGTVSSVSVNGVAATSSDLFATWTATVPLSVGANTLTANVRTSTGQTGSATAAITRGTTADHTPDDVNPFTAPGDMVFDVANNRAFVVNADGNAPAVYVVNLTTGARTILSNNTTPDANNPFQLPHGIALDAANNRLLVADRNARAVIAVNLTTGARTILFSDASFYPHALAIDSANNRVIEASSITVSAIDLTTGTRTVISDNTTPDATNPFHDLYGVVLDSANNRVLVADVSAAIIAVNLATGARTILSSNTTPDASNPFLYPQALVLDSAHNRLLVADSGVNALIAVNLTTGARTVVSNNSAPNGVNAFVYGPYGLGMDTTNNRMLTGDFCVLSIDLTNGHRVIFSQ